jgi:secreted PhoX family phosphatase
MKVNCNLGYTPHWLGAEENWDQHNYGATPDKVFDIDELEKVYGICHDKVLTNYKVVNKLAHYCSDRGLKGWYGETTQKAIDAFTRSNRPLTVANLCKAMDCTPNIGNLTIRRLKAKGIIHCVETLPVNRYVLS